MSQIIEPKSVLRELLPKCGIADRRKFRRELRRAHGEALERLTEHIERSVARCEQRRSSIPELDCPANLPISALKTEIVDAIQSEQILILCGETGSGKTTQLPKMCLEAGRGIYGLIGHTQPRRLAARAVAERIATEMGCGLGELVGLQTRFQQRVADENLVKVMTDGILLAEIQRDRYLNRYDTIVIDEAHERSLNIDFLLGYLKRLLAERRDLKLIITSATLDIERVAGHFANARVIEVPGRSFPVEQRYSPIGADDEEDMYAAVDRLIDELQHDGRGDVLVFLPGEREIRELSRSLRHRRDTFDVLPLYARLPPGEQAKIFGRAGKVRIILSTNVAETSLTVPGIRYVIDNRSRAYFPIFLAFANSTPADRGSVTGIRGAARRTRR